jgi:hypothetical protein
MWASIGSVSPDPARVWLVRPGSPDAVEGRLSLERHALTVIMEGDEALPIPTGRIRRVRRRRGTPILELDYTDARAEVSTVFIYFVKPPPLHRTGRGTLVLPSRGIERAAGAVSLRASNRRLKPMVTSWARAIREAARI